MTPSSKRRTKWKKTKPTKKESFTMKEQMGRTKQQPPFFLFFPRVFWTVWCLGNAPILQILFRAGLSLFLLAKRRSVLKSWERSSMPIGIPLGLSLLCLLIWSGSISKRNQSLLTAIYGESTKILIFKVLNF